MGGVSARLSDNGIEALVLLFLAFEKLGDWCDILNLVLIVLVPKAEGGRRPIGLFPTLIRVWMRARIWAAREWEEAQLAFDICWARHGSSKGLVASGFCGRGSGAGCQ